MKHPPLFTHALDHSGCSRRAVTRTGLAVVLASAVATTSAVVATSPAGARTATSTVTLKATADAYTSASAPRTNYGTGSSLRLTERAGAAKTSFLSFSVPATPGQTVTKAELVLQRTTRHLPATSVSARSVSGAFTSESSLDNANAPKVGSAIAVATTTAATASVNLDVTSAVKHSGTVVLALTSPVTTGVVQFASREAGVTGPQLVLTVQTTATTPAKCTVSSLLVSSCGRWLGVAPQTYSGMTAPAALAVDENFTGSSFALAHEYKTNGRLFPTAADISVAEQTGRNRLLLENWKPATDETWARVAAGGADARIDAEAAYLKSHFDLPFFLTVWHEPENDVNTAAGSGMTVSDYKAMYRHTVLRLRADGADKFISVMNYMGFGRWNSMLDGLYPGDDVVDWLAYDPYQVKASAAVGHDFADMVNRSYQSAPGFYTWATSQHPTKPLMLAEWGALYDPANPGGQAAFFRTIASQIGAFPALKALVYFDIDTKYGNIDGKGTTPDSSAASLAAWKATVNAPEFATPSFHYGTSTIVPNS